MASPRLCVIGAGIGGLATAWHAQKAGFSVLLLEKSDELGGLVAGFPFGGTYLDKFYRHVFPGSEALLALLEELPLSGDLKPHDSTTGLYSEGKLYPFNGPRDLLRFRPLSFLGKVQFALGTLLATKRDSFEALEGIPASTWVKARFGKQAYSKVWGPLLSAKFGARGAEVPASWLLSRLKDRAESRKQGKREQLAYLSGSFQRLVEALAEELRRKGVEILTQSPLLHLEAQEQGFSVRFPAGETKCDYVVAALPLQEIADKLDPALHARLDDKMLAPCDYAANSCTVLALDRPLTPFYWLNLADETLPFTGVIEHTNFIPPSEYGGLHAVYLSHYLEPDSGDFEKPDEALLSLYFEALNRINPAFDASWVQSAQTFRWRYAQPIFTLNYSSRRPPFATDVPGLYQLNMAQHYPYSRQMNTSILLAYELVKSLTS